MNIQAVSSKRPQEVTYSRLVSRVALFVLSLLSLLRGTEAAPNLRGSKVNCANLQKKCVSLLGDLADASFPENEWKNGLMLDVNDPKISQDPKTKNIFKIYRESADLFYRHCL